MSYICGVKIKTNLQYILFFIFGIVLHVLKISETLKNIKKVLNIKKQPSNEKVFLNLLHGLQLSIQCIENSYKKDKNV